MTFFQNSITDKEKIYIFAAHLDPINGFKYQ